MPKEEEIGDEIEVAYDFEIDSTDRGNWIKIINKQCFSEIKSNIGEPQKRINLRLTSKIHVEDLQPALIVLLACYIKHLNMNNYQVNTIIEDKSLSDYIFNTLQFSKYFNENADHVPINESKILNLWHIDIDRIEEYGITVTEYFERNYFKGKDLSAFKKTLDEIFGNISDHSLSSGKAYSFIYYDENLSKISFAACDFGLGIPTTLRNSGKIYHSDSDALRDSLKLGVTANSRLHNRGHGLDNVVSAIDKNDILRIVSNKALLFCKNNKADIETYELEFNFKGCLIYFDLSVNTFPNEDVEDIFIM